MQAPEQVRVEMTNQLVLTGHRQVPDLRFVHQSDSFLYASFVLNRNDRVRHVLPDAGGCAHMAHPEGDAR